MRRLGVAAGALLALGVAGEALLRLSPDFGGGQNEIATQLQLDKMAYAPDAELGALLAPSRHDAVLTLDFSYTLQTDHAGFPNPEPWPDRIDVAVLGNSLLIGPGIGMAGQFTSLLEQLLSGPSVLNLGLPGGGTEHELLTYRRYVKPLHPALVVAALWVVWDIDNSAEFEHWQREQKPDPDYTHYRYTFNQSHPTGTPVAPSAFERVWHLVTNQLARSHLLKAGYRGLKTMLGRQQIRERVEFPNGESILLSVRDQQRLALGMDRPDLPEIREVFFRPLERLKAEVEAENGRFLVVLVPSKEELYGAEAFPAILRPIQEVRAGLEARGLPVLDLYQTFRRQGEERPPFYRADMHLNAFGNQLVADALAQWIADQNIFTKSPPGSTVAGTAAK